MISEAGFYSNKIGVELSKYDLHVVFRVTGCIPNFNGIKGSCLIYYCLSSRRKRFIIQTFASKQNFMFPLMECPAAIRYLVEKACLSL